MSIERIRQLERYVDELTRQVNRNNEHLVKIETYWKIAIGELTFISSILIIVLIQILKI